MPGTSSNGTQTVELPQRQTQSAVMREPLWQVIVLNDPVNLMTYVVYVFQKVFGYTRTKATEHMLEVHQQGRSVLWSGPRERAEHYLNVLQNWQLNACIAPDREGEGD